MSQSTIYKAQLLAHFKNPLNRTKGDLAHMQIVAQGSNPRCGDDIIIGFNAHEQIIEPVQFKGRGCSICIASASMMTESIKTTNLKHAHSLACNMQKWMLGENILLPESLQALEAVRNHKARHKCVMLPWHALLNGLEQLNIVIKS